MDPRILRALVSEDPRAPATSPHRHAEVIAHFRAVIERAWSCPSDETRRAKRQLDYFCGHIDCRPPLRDFIPVTVVAAHYSALNRARARDDVSFNAALGMYLSLLNAEVRNGPHADEFRGASVALTFDSARHDANILRFVDDGPVLAKVMVRDRSRSR